MPRVDAADRSDDCSQYTKNLDVLAATKLASDSAVASGPPVLILGGSTFMGRELVQAMLAKSARVCIVNRGRSYWGTKDVSGGRAAHLTADRNKPQTFAQRLDEVTTFLGGNWALVADFSAYNEDDIHASLAGLHGRFETYVYISSDSVYEVSAWAGRAWKSEASGLFRSSVAEDATVRPDDKHLRAKLRQADSYGDGKLRAEEALSKTLSCALRAEQRCLALRLPDVIGPFDDTLRLWAYWHWLRAGVDYAPQVRDLPAAKRRKHSDTAASENNETLPEDPGLAFVFSRDVARFITGLVGSTPPPGIPQFDSVNLACDQQPTLRELLVMLAKASGLKAAPQLQAVKHPKTFLPSVDRPWPLSCQHAAKAYGFSATSLDEVLRICSDWFAEACVTFKSEAIRAAKKLPKGADKAAMQHSGLDPPSSSSSRSSSATSSSS